jgi:hypothetical protein
VVFEGRGDIGYYHRYDALKFYLGLALDPKYIEGFVEGCLERTSEDEPDTEALPWCSTSAGSHSRGQLGRTVGDIFSGNIQLYPRYSR